MLVLSRKVGEKIVIGDNIVVEVVKVKGNRVTLGLVAPKQVSILRNELDRHPHAERQAASTSQSQNSTLVQADILRAG